MEFTNEPIDLSFLPKYEEAPLQSLHPDYWKVITINLFIFLLLLGMGIISLFWMGESLKPYLMYITGGYAILVASLFILYRLSYKRRGIALRERDIIYRSGILSTTTTIIPFNRIQHVALNEGMISRIYKLGTLDIYTAGGATGNLSIPGLEIEQARKIKELLLKKVDHVS